MPRPIFGIGHSMGGSHLVNIALFNPRLFEGLILLDPVVQPRTAEVVKGAEKTSLAAMSTFRRDVWPSREEARKGFEKSAFYRSWDDRVLDKWVSYGLREGPTVLYPDAKEREVTLTTPVGQEVYTFLRRNFNGNGVRRGGKVNRKTHADVDPKNGNSWPFYRSEPTRTFTRLEELRPAVLYVIGGESNVNNQELDEIRMVRTGKGVGGSGGADEGRVESVTLDGVGHLLPMEASGETARVACEWLDKEVQRWKEEEEELERMWFKNGKSAREKQEIDEDWKRYMGGPPKRGGRGSKI